MQTMTMLQMVEKAKNGQFFSICFVKRTNGQVREMTCKRAAVPIGEWGMRYDPTGKGLLVVWDTQVRDFRMVSLDRVRWLKMGGQTFDWDGRQWVEREVAVA
jgi:hypothetical protein